MSPARDGTGVPQASTLLCCRAWLGGAQGTLFNTVEFIERASHTGLPSLQTSSHKSHFQHQKLFFLIKEKKPEQTKTETKNLQQNHKLQAFHMKLFQKCFWSSCAWGSPWPGMTRAGREVGAGSECS